MVDFAKISEPSGKSTPLTLDWEPTRSTTSPSSMDKFSIDWLVHHQANLRIIKAAAKKLSLPLEQVVGTVDDHANTSAASIPLALNEAVKDGRIKEDQVLLLEAFGSGFTWGSVLLRY